MPHCGAFFIPVVLLLFFFFPKRRFQAWCFSDHALVIPETVTRPSEGFIYTDVEGFVERGWCCVELLCVLHLGELNLPWDTCVYSCCNVTGLGSALMRGSYVWREEGMTGGSGCVFIVVHAVL